MSRRSTVAILDEARKYRSDLVGVTERLIEDFDWVPAGRVLATVAVCRSELARTGVRGEGLLEATEAMARSRMNARAPGQRFAPPPPSSPGPLAPIG